MALEPVPAETVDTSSQDGGLAASLTNALIGAPDPAAPQTPEPPAPEIPEAAPAEPAAPEPAKPQDPVKAVEEAVEGDDEEGIKLPIDEVEEKEPEPAEPAKTEDKVGRRIEALKAEIKTEWKPKVAELESTLKQKDARIQELEGTQNELSELREKLKSYETEMSVVRLENTEAYRKTVAEPLTAIETRALKIAEEYGLEPSKVLDTIAEPDGARRKASLKSLTSGVEIDQFDLVELHNLAEQAQPIFGKRDELYRNADSALAELQARAEAEQQQQAAERAELRAKAAEVVSKRMTSKLPFFGDAVGAAVEKVKSTAFEAVDPNNQAYYMLAGEALPQIAKAHAALQKQVDELLDEVAAYRKSSPRVTGVPATEAPGKPRTDLGKALMAGMGLVPVD